MISGYDYEAPKVDIVYHTGVLCQVRQQEYEKWEKNELTKFNIIFEIMFS